MHILLTNIYSSTWLAIIRNACLAGVGDRFQCRQWHGAIFQFRLETRAERPSKILIDNLFYTEKRDTPVRYALYHT